jgi:ATP-dependent Zn protease
MVDLLIELLVSSIPILLLIAVWIYFMRKNRSGMQTQKLMPAYLEKDIELKERIASALEKLADSKDASAT